MAANKGLLAVLGIGSLWTYGSLNYQIDSVAEINTQYLVENTEINYVEYMGVQYDNLSDIEIRYRTRRVTLCYYDDGSKLHWDSRPVYSAYSTYEYVNGTTNQLGVIVPESEFKQYPTHSEMISLGYTYDSNCLYDAAYYKIEKEVDYKNSAGSWVSLKNYGGYLLSDTDTTTVIDPKYITIENFGITESQVAFGENYHLILDIENVYDFPITMALVDGVEYDLVHNGEYINTDQYVLQFTNKTVDSSVAELLSTKTIEELYVNGKWIDIDDITAEHILRTIDNVGYEEEISSIQKQIDNMKSELATLAEDQARAEANLDLINQNIAAAVSELNSLESDKTNLVQELNSLNSELAAATSELEQVQSDHADLVQQIADAESYLESLEQNKSNLQLDIDNLTSELAALNLNKATLESDIAVAESELAIIEQQIIDGEGDLEELEQSKSDLLQQIDDMNSELATLNSDKENLESDIAAAQSDLASLELQISNREDDLNTLEQSKNDLQSDIDNMTSELATLNSNKDSVQAIIDNLNNQIALKTASINSLNAELDSVNQELANQEYRLNELKALVDSYEVVKADKWDELEAYKEQKEQLEEEIARLEQLRYEASIEEMGWFASAWHSLISLPGKVIDFLAIPFVWIYEAVVGGIEWIIDLF